MPKVVESVNIDITKLKSGIVSTIEINGSVTIPEEYLKQADMTECSKVEVQGFLTKDALGELEMTLSIKGTATIPCAITLEPVSVPFQIETNGNLNEMFEEIGENVKNSSNSLDILPIIWENILMEIPMRVVSEKINTDELNLEGNGWKLVTQKDKNEEINPALEKLKDLL